MPDNDQTVFEPEVKEERRPTMVKREKIFVRMTERPWAEQLREKMRDWHDMDKLAGEGNEFAAANRQVLEQEIVAMIVQRIKAKDTGNA